MSTSRAQFRSGASRPGIQLQSWEHPGRYLSRNQAESARFVIDDIVVSQADPEQRIEMLRAGFPADIVTELASSMRWSRDHTLAVTRVKRSTAMRKIKDKARLATDESERILAVIDLIGQVERMIERSGNPDDFDAAAWLADWLESANPSLGGKHPADYLDTNEGIGIVRRLLAQMESGAYA
ncbi:MAG: DUF2384 domain-containing protein [Thauera sp.]|nr:DUF2384 domain-containing protein [Thauera sp.]